MKTSKFYLFTLSLFFSLSIFAQEEVKTEEVKATERFTAHNKGKFFISWGGNRDSYSNSDITFRGDNYNFTLDNMQAQDKPKGWHVDYINPTRMTIPQTNFRFGYFINDHYSISAGWDHMKYVMTPYQTVNMTGTISGHPPFDGEYNDTPTVMTPEFLMFEHTDGLNYVNAEFSRFDDISSIFKIKNTDKIQINITEGVGAGILYPKTNTTLMGQERHDDFNVAGYGVSIKAGLNITFLKYFFIQGELKGGYINMQDIRTTKYTSDSAFQDFFFFERIIAIGGIFRL